MVTELQNALACAGRVFELIDEPAQTPDPADAAAARPPRRRGRPSTTCHFSYAPDRQLIEDFTLHVQPGQRVAIVGPTGCGKTTHDQPADALLRCGFRRQSAWTATRSRTPDAPQPARKHTAWCLQDTWLSAGTIRENIAMGKPDATDEEIIAAAKASHAHSFITRLPDGLRHRHQRGRRQLSQGQKQLLCIARVMLCLPPMLILDEATSSIDTRTELQIQEAFARMMQGRTSFVVAHRLSTIHERGS